MDLALGAFEERRVTLGEAQIAAGADQLDLGIVRLDHFGRAVGAVVVGDENLQLEAVAVGADRGEALVQVLFGVPVDDGKGEVGSHATLAARNERQCSMGDDVGLVRARGPTLRSRHLCALWVGIRKGPWDW